MDHQISLDMLMDTYNQLEQKLTNYRIKAFVDHLRKYDLTLNQFAILTKVQREGPCLSVHLAQYLEIKAASITYLVDSLEQRGYVNRIDNPEDRRSHRITLTDKGNDVLFIPEMDLSVKEQFEQLDEEDKEMVYLSIRLLNRKLK
ncbi:MULTISPECIES: MarR family winged helix-turn-helix transcriptional regulator [Paenibacillus]|uniref:MarR family transcriptional regulator n=1 Tax=Paenibacillus polygoni TaxID=3050112 RepID=A0ABY8X4Q5_9BACL|nr:MULTISPECIES: MarR family transcriptional regulator [Paenibacillus]WIV19664.1 MarR family transcriptional regulator [Paenibacillus polygoni]